MILALLLAVPFLCGVLCLLVPSRALMQTISFIGLLVNSGLLLSLSPLVLAPSLDSLWLIDLSVPWIASLGVNFHLGLDRLSFSLILLTLVLGVLAIFSSQPKKSMASYFASLNWCMFGVTGLFLSADIFLFFVFWELALLPIYWITIVEGEALKLAQALRFIIMTQASGLILLIGIIGLALEQSYVSGSLTFDYASFLHHDLSPSVQSWLFLCFLLAFLIKLPAVPFHGWLPALFSQGPASVILIAILVKTSVFGLLRFSWAIFPNAASEYSEAIMIVGVITILYGAVLAFSQKEAKSILAYGTISHAGLLVIGVFCSHNAGFYGVVLLLTSSALNTAAMLVMLERRREALLMPMTGLLKTHPKFSVMLLIMVLAGMGFPLFGNFVGEVLILWSVFSENLAVAILVSLSIVLSAVYGLRLFQRLCLGEPQAAFKAQTLADLSGMELVLCGAVTIFLIGLGLSPSFALENLATPFAQKATSNAELVGSRESSQVVLP